MKVVCCRSSKRGEYQTLYCSGGCSGWGYFRQGWGWGGFQAGERGGISQWWPRGEGGGGLENPAMRYVICKIILQITPLVDLYTKHQYFGSWFSGSWHFARIRYWLLLNPDPIRIRIQAKVFMTGIFFYQKPPYTVYRFVFLSLYKGYSSFEPSKRKVHKT